jgi:hypothetical protein
LPLEGDLEIRRQQRAALVERLREEDEAAQVLVQELRQVSRWGRMQQAESRRRRDG